MNCNKTRKFLLAFADGQMSVQANCEVLDHLKMCRACSAIVDDHQSLRRAIAKSAERIAAPAGLGAKVRHAIERDGMGKARRPGAPAPGFRLAPTLAAAACVVIVAAASWQYVSTRSNSGSPSFASDAPEVRSRADELTQSVVIQHNKCSLKSSEHQAHQLASLSHDRAIAAEQIDEHFAGALATAAPDLTGYGYEFESANYCNPAHDATGPAAHLLYVNYSNGTYLSLFTRPHWADIDMAGRSPDRAEPFVHSMRDCESNSMIAWHEGEMTYVFVGKVDAEAIAAMIRDLQLRPDAAGAGGPTAARGAVSP